MQLFADQQALKNDVYRAWNEGARVVMPVLPTGGGKTVIVSDIFSEESGPSCFMAHRQELVSQISLTFARFDIKHRIIAPDPTIREIAAIHSDELGTSKHIDRNALAAVSGVDTLLKRHEQFTPFLNSVRLFGIDEGHHVLDSNKWGTASRLFPNARGILPTATPRRADRKGLGVEADGIVDRLVEGPQMRDLINAGRLCDYRMICSKKQALDLHQVAVSDTTGDYNATQLRNASRNKKAEIAGDVVEEYLKHAPGKLGVTFAVDIETACAIADQFRAKGVPAEVVSAKTPARARAAVLRDFRERKLMQLINVDIFGEGFDLPAIEVVSFARPTKSFSLYFQQFGRVLRVLEGKEYGLIIDHVGNVIEHGLPDAPQVWTLERGTKNPPRKPTDAIPLRACPCCSMPYETVLLECPFCGEPYMPADRSSPKAVAGDLVELDPEVLKMLRQEVEKAHESLESIRHRVSFAAGDMAASNQVNHQRNRLQALEALQISMDWWASYYAEKGIQPREVQKRFYHAFEIDVLSAKALKRAEALALADRINADIGRLQVERVH